MVTLHVKTGAENSKDSKNQEKKGATTSKQNILDKGTQKNKHKYEQHFKAIWEYVFKLGLHWWGNEQDAKELAQDVAYHILYLIVKRKQKLFCTDSGLPYITRTVARRKFFDQLHFKVMHNIIDPETAKELEFFCAEPWEVMRALEPLTSRLEVPSAPARLDLQGFLKTHEKDYEVPVRALRYELRGLTHAEIAQEMGRSVNQVKYLLEVIKQHMRDKHPELDFWRNDSDPHSPTALRKVA